MIRLLPLFKERFMSILSDRQIRTLCVPPATVFDRAGYDKEILEADTTGQQSMDLRHHTTFGGHVAAAEQKVRDRIARHTHPITAEQKAAFRPMISPYAGESIKLVEYPNPVPEGNPIYRVPALSFGSSSFGYDVRLAEEFKIFSNINSGIIDPKRLDEVCLVDGTIHKDYSGHYVLLPPNSYLLGRTIETFDIPRDVMVVCLGKSTYARAGAIVNVTPIEPGFKGTVVIEISNSTNLPLKIYANEGISQFLFFQGSEPCEVSYDDRTGKYQHQSGITLPKV
jgi:dCTP deaminase